MLSAHDLVTIVLVYLAIGSLGWFAAFCSGVIHESYGKHPSVPGIVIASVCAIVLWPWLVGVIVLAIWNGARGAPTKPAKRRAF